MPGNYEQPKKPEQQPDINVYIQTWALQSELSGFAKKYLDKLVASLNQVLNGRTTREMAEQQDVAGLEKYLELVTVINKLLKTKESPEEKESWDWEIGRRVVFDVAELEKKYTGKRVYTPVFSADGENYLVHIYDSNNQDDPEAVMVKNGQELAWTKGVKSYLQALSPDGQAVGLSYVKANDKQAVMIDGRDLGIEFDEIQNLYFSEDSLHLLIEANNKEIVDPQEDPPSYRITRSVIMVNNKIKFETAQEIDMLSEPVMDHDGKKTACIVIDDDGWSCINNGQRWQQSFNECHGLTYSPDGQKLAAVVADELNDVTIAENGNIIWGNRYEDWGCRPVYSPDGSKLAIAVMFKNKEGQPEDYSYKVLENDKQIWPEKFYRIGKLVYSPDSENLAAIVEVTPWKRAIVINGQPIMKQILNVENLSFSPDGKKIMFVGRESLESDETNKYIRVVMDIEKFLY